MTGFAGVIGRTATDSTPWWMPPRLPSVDSPDIVMIVLDDVGFSDLGCFGSELKTPAIDRLAEEGLRYRNFHSTALCSPTRACLLTGRNHHAVGMGSLPSRDTGFPNSRGAITPAAATLAEVLRDHGYRTFALGKWHLAPLHELSPSGPFDNWPLQRGFDRFYGFLGGLTDHWHPELVHDNHPIHPPHRPDYHLSEDLVTEAIAWVRDLAAVAPTQPFFLYLAFGAAHTPHQAPLEFVDRDRGRFDRGWDRVREDRLSRQIEMGVVPSGTQLSPRNPGVVAWEELGHAERRVFARLQEAYAGMLEHADAQIARLVDHLALLGRLDGTLVVVVSDNGAHQAIGPSGNPNLLADLNGRGYAVDEALEQLDEIGGPLGYSTYPWGWAQAGNTPFKRYKHNSHAGGVQVPLVLRWPAAIADPGAVRPQFHHAIDVMPTILEIVGVDPPDSHRGTPQIPVAGTSMAYTFAEPDAADRRRTQHFETGGHRGIWADGWKAVAYHDATTDFDDDVWELYDLENDFSECDDLSARRPEKLRTMVEQWWAEAGAHGVLPLHDAGNSRPPLESRHRGPQTFVYSAGVAHLPCAAAPPFLNRNYWIRAELSLRRDDEGVLLAFGGRHGGFVLYVVAKRLVHDYNVFGGHHVLQSSAELPTGDCAVGVEVHHSHGGAGQVRLVVDASTVAEAMVDQLPRNWLAMEGLDIGRDALSPVSDNYDGEFPFTGTIHRVVVEVGAA